ncbi:hypothetical protein GCM10007916_34410 [Psychromonas marina]|uniref:Uncharacterized protein n=1 Tax=Psychromonas marina TaxID=88364 RepID=A0ABQ6E5H8_9GAMM|nr:hypothetical protein GCM10007916_34410 [Psychromonas marina]
MHTCKYCGEPLPILKHHRSLKERLFTHRNEEKYKCVNCQKMTFKAVKFNEALD